MRRNLIINSSLFGLLLFYTSFSGSAQVDLKTSAETWLLASTKNDLPFWLHMNRRGRFTEETDFLGLISTEAQTGFGNHQFRIGGGFLYNERLGKEVQVDEAFLEYNYKWFKVILGVQQRLEYYNGLSATNENILWSLNAAPLPGIQVQTSLPIFFSRSQKFAFEAAWEEYFLGEDRYVQNAQLHHKQLSFIYHPREDWQIKAGIQHFAFWSGISPVLGQQPSGLDDYIRVITGREGGANAAKGDQINVLGSHLGSYELYMTKFFEDSEVQFLYNSIFEDGSGSRGANIPDGRYGVYFNKTDEIGWISSAIYEFYYTRNQSQTGPHLFDFYFNNWVYASGFTNRQQVLGVPFITTNYYEDYPLGTSTIRIGNNNLLVHHFGLSGTAFETFPFTFTLSYRRNYGHYRNTGTRTYEYYPADDPRGQIQLDKEILSQYLSLRLLNSNVKIDLTFAADFSANENNVGGGVSVKYEAKN